ncbi:hypothetical protein ACSS6W_003606 [Trichoderma asperelloides]
MYGPVPQQVSMSCRRFGDGRPSQWGRKMTRLCEPKIVNETLRKEDRIAAASEPQISFNW